MEEVSAMPFIDSNDTAPDATLIGEHDGTAAIYLVRQTVPAGYYAGLHYHHGDEAIRVISGEVRCRIGEETRVCGPGTILVIPPNVEHGFIVLTDSVLETFGQRKVGSYTIVLDPDGTRRVVETFVQGRPWHHDPPAGTGHTTLEEQKRLQRTTLHLIQAGSRPVPQR
jgi:quercetin dioxygenase-like cupin family protein